MKYLLLITAFIVPLLVIAIIQDYKEWEEFKVTHNCKKIAHVDGNIQNGVGYGLTTNGTFGVITTITSTPDKTAWECDDGVTYWK